MKPIFHYISLLILTTVLFSSCKKERTDLVTTTITPAKTTGPAATAHVVVSPASNAVLTFTWEPAKTGNYSGVFYEVQFDKENGNFTKPIYRSGTGRQNVEPKLVLSHKEVNKLAYAAGIPELATGKVRWRVVASNGVIEAFSEPSVISLARPAGFAENPTDVYLSGEATETGADLAKAMKFKRLSDGVFELYTALSPGSYKLTDKTSGTPLTFSVDGGLLKEAASGASPAAVKTVYRINLDFNKSTAVLTEIQSAGLWFAPYNRIQATLAYAGQGVFRATDVQVTWKQETWGKDERYKFRVSEKGPAGTIAVRNWGSSNKDNSRPTSGTAASYFFLREVDNTQYDYTYKFMSESEKADIELNFGASADYTHKITFK
ncbi:hypothetical protein C7T94_09645 [Pedobacter yulinensis]|uniref:SusE outer membrane protein domain-containing protein n=1 Tax=Pedobacter yulinensis TaxID=2126353 RepID=A0A2T3HKE4_9SPHI|nr:SusE domain-containing protein [Pedobacter yulinensis]PST82889.1 hypothetical protein C7T94_09645 [Pedobacter yulinensis]